MECGSDFHFPAHPSLSPQYFLMTFSLAKSYDHPTEKQGGVDHSNIRLEDQLKGGFTPSILQNNSSRANRVLDNRLQKYRRNRFSGAPHTLSTYDTAPAEFLLGFTVAELIASGICAGQLAVLVPQTSGPVPIPEWKTGLLGCRKEQLLSQSSTADFFTQASRADVWAVLEPGARLASQVVANSHIWLWYRGSAIANGQEAWAEVQRSSELLTQDLKFQLWSGNIDPDTSLSLHVVSAVTTFQYRGSTIVWVSFELLTPLLRGDITVAEKSYVTFE
ncbi:unnamed protein product [Diplocarpon coronariae]